MISIIRIGCSDKPSGSRVMDALRSDEDFDAPPADSIRKLIVIKKINPEEFEDQEEVNDMSEREDDDLNISPEELAQAEEEIPPEVDKMSMDELGLTEDDIDDLGGGDEGESDDLGGDLSPEELDAIEKEIPPEIDALKDEDLEADADLEGEEAPGEIPEAEEGSSKKEKEVEEEVEEGAGLNDYL